VDFLVESSENYILRFEDRKVFGKSIAALKKGHNIFISLNGQDTDTYVFFRVYGVWLAQPGRGDDRTDQGPSAGWPHSCPNPHVESKKLTGARRR